MDMTPSEIQNWWRNKTETLLNDCCFVVQQWDLFSIYVFGEDWKLILKSFCSRKWMNINPGFKFYNFHVAVQELCTRRSRCCVSYLNTTDGECQTDRQAGAWSNIQKVMLPQCRRRASSHLETHALRLRSPWCQYWTTQLEGSWRLFHLLLQ